MMKGINSFLLFMTVAISASAGDKSLDVVIVDTTLTNQKKNDIAKPVVSEKYEYYEVCGCCEKDLQCELQQKCIKWTDGKKYDSVTKWKVKWDYGYNRAQQSCSADSFQVTVDVVFRYPKWATSDNAPRQLVDKWDADSKSLAAHENGHRDRAVEAAAALTREVADLPPARTCADLDRQVQNLSRIRMEKLIDDQNEYDAATNHGRLQGAVFP